MFLYIVSMSQSIAPAAGNTQQRLVKHKQWLTLLGLVNTADIPPFTSLSCCCREIHLSVCDRERLLTHTSHRGTLARQNAISHRDPTFRPRVIIMFLGCKMVIAFKCNWTTWGFETSIFENMPLDVLLPLKGMVSDALESLSLCVNVFVLAIMNEEPS